MDPSFNLDGQHIRFGRVCDSNVISIYKDDKCLTACDTSDFTAFVFPPNQYLGYYGYQHFLQCQPKVLSPNQPVVLKKKDKNGLPLKGTIKDMFSEFHFSVNCTNGNVYDCHITDLEDNDEYNLHVGDYIFFVV